MPKRFAVGRIQSEEIAGVIGCEEQVTRGGEDAGDAFAIADFVVPDHFAGAVIECTNGGVGPKNAVAAAPTFSFSGDGVVVNAEEAARVDEEESGLRIEAGGHPVGGAVGAGRN